MTRQEAANILRTEQIGDSEQMELAKQMGAEALDKSSMKFIAPRCAKCGEVILGLEIVNLPEPKGHALFMTSAFRPGECPSCGLIFDQAVVDTIEETCILKGRESTTAKIVRCGECILRTSGRPTCQGRPKDWFCADGKKRGETEK